MVDPRWHEATRLFELTALVDARTSDRKRRLFAVACLRRFAHLLADPRSQRALEVADRLAEGVVSEEERQQAEDAAFEAHAELREARLGGDTLLPWSWQHEQLTRAAALAVSRGLYYAEDVADYARRSLAGTAGGWEAEQIEESTQCRLLLEIVGPLPPGSISVDPLWLSAQDGAVAALAQCAYESQAYDLLPILADALEDAGCNHPLLLEHCRGPEAPEIHLHVRGCWVLDLLTGRE